MTHNWAERWSAVFRVRTVSLVTVTRLSGNGRGACKVDGWGTSYDEEMGVKTTHLSPALPPFTVIMRRIHSKFVSVIVVKFSP